MVLLPSVTQTHGTDDVMLTCEDLPLLLDTVGFAGTSVKEEMGNERTENSRPGHRHKV